MSRVNYSVHPVSDMDGDYPMTENGFSSLRKAKEYLTDHSILSGRGYNVFRDDVYYATYKWSTIYRKLVRISPDDSARMC